MENKTLEIKCAIQILSSSKEVFDAIVDPVKMAYYFIEKSTGKMEEGKNLRWKFPEFEEEAPLRVGKIIEEKYISYYWEGSKGKEMFVEITLESTGPGKTLVTVTEKEMANDEAGIKWLKSNTEGWANFLACMKAFLEYGISLRKGAFDYRTEEKE